jgi:hypothetical protein
MSDAIYSETPSHISSEFKLSAPERVIDELNKLLQESMAGQPMVHQAALDSLETLAKSLLSQSKSRQQKLFVNELFSLCRIRLESEMRFIRTLNTQQKTARTGASLLFQTALPRRQVEMIRILTCFKRRVLKSRAKKGLRGRDALTVDSGLTVFFIKMVLQRFLKRSGVLDRIHEHFPNSTKVTGVAIEHSAAGSTWWKSSSVTAGTPDTDYIHIDEVLEAPKAILYLSDVNEQNGPTEFFPELLEQMTISPLKQLVGRVISNIGSSPQSDFYGAFGPSGQRTSSIRFCALFWSLPESIRFNSHFGWDVTPGNPIVLEVNRRRITAVGKPGTLSVFDGSRVAHRGGLILDGERTVLQVVFGQHDAALW